jgi:hypothetical protein
MFSKPVHKTIHLICLLLVAFMMPVSVWALSVVSLTGAVNWILSGDYGAKIRVLKNRKDVVMLIMLFAMYLLWLLNTSDLKSAMFELKLKLPLLFFPLVISTYTKSGFEQLRIMLLAFITGCVVAAGAGFMVLAGWWPREVNDSRDLALFVPSIRLSILLNFAIFIAMWLSSKKKTGGIVLRIALATAAAAMTIFLFRLLALTGIIIFIIIMGETSLYLILYRKQHLAGIILAMVAGVLTATCVIVMTTTWRSLHYPDHPEINHPLMTTSSGRPYTQYPEETLLENGYLVWMNVCEDELRREWNDRGIIAYDSTDNRGNELRVTLIRYITYLGMTKDSSAVALLSAGDISNIERGFANPLYAHPVSVRAKAYELAWQIDRTLKGANPSGHSVTQRFEFYRAAAGIIRAKPWLGVGTGDVKNAFADEYNAINSPLSGNYRLRAHNQFLTFAVTFGIPGMIIALALMLLPWLRSPVRAFYPFVLFISIIFISMFNDDTFSSFTSATFFSYFYTLFLISEIEHGT